MSGDRRVLAAVGALCGGIAGLVSGTVFAVTAVSSIVGMGAQILGAMVSWIPFMREEPQRYPIPEFDFFSPALLLVVGVTLFLCGWVAVIRGTTALWPSRFDRTQQDDS